MLPDDLVIVVDPAQVVEFEVARQRGGLARDALHHAAVPGQGINVEVEQVEAGAVEVGRSPLGSDGHADTGGHALAERPRGGLHAGGPAVLGVAGALAVELAKLLDLVQGDRRLAQALVLVVDRLDAGQVQHGVKQHGGVAHGQHEAVAVRPDGVAGVEAEEALPQAVRDRGHGHRRAGVARVGRLDRVHGQAANGVDGGLLQRRRPGDGRYGRTHGGSSFETSERFPWDVAGPPVPCGWIILGAGLSNTNAGAGHPGAPSTPQAPYLGSSIYPAGGSGQCAGTRLSLARAAGGGVMPVGLLNQPARLLDAAPCLVRPPQRAVAPGQVRQCRRVIRAGEKSLFLLDGA